MTFAETEAKADSALARGMARKTRGLCMSIDDVTGLTVINVGGGSQSMPIVGKRPTVGWDAWVLYVEEQPLCMGPVYRSPGAIVTVAPDAGKVEVLRDDGVTSLLPYASVMDLIVGDRVIINWESGYVQAEPAAEPTVVVPVPPPGGGAQVRESVFYPIDSGTFTSAWGGRSVYCGATTIGAYFYQGIADTIPDSAEILSVRLYVHATLSQFASPTFGVHSLGGRVGTPVVTDAVAVPMGTGWKDLPTGFGDLLKTGARLGVGTNHGGYHIFSPANVNNSGALVIKHRG